MGSILAKQNSTCSMSQRNHRLSDAENSISDDQLKAASQSWTQEQWETYLHTIEFPSYETLISDSEFRNILENQIESIFEIAQSPCSPETSSQVWRAMQKLTAREREVVHLIFWRGASEREVASHLGITRPSVQVLKRRALRKLKEALSSILHM